ncbi:MAG: hypothetical protein NVS3B7_14640 [Candidatus Elarobacter sp.]
MPPCRLTAPLSLAGIISGALACLAGAQEPSTRTIASIRRDSVALTAAAIPVTIAGRVTLGTGVLDDVRLSVFVQDPSGGIQVYGPRIERPVEAGDSVVVTGIVKPYRGLAEIADAAVRIVGGARQTPTAVEVTDFRPATLARHMGRVVALQGRVVGARGVGSSVRLHLRDTDGESGDSTSIALWGTLHGEVALDRFGVGDRLRVTGILTRRDERDIRSAEYVLLANARSDVNRLGVTSRQRRMALLALIPIGLVAVLLWMRVEAHRKEQQLESIERRFNTLYQHSPDAVFMLGADWRVDEANEGASRLTSLPLPLLHGRDFSELFAPEDIARLARAAEDIRTRGSIELEAHVVLPRDGRAIVSLRLFAMPEGEGRRVLAVLRDISPQRALEEQLRQAQKMEAVGQLAGGVAHDFNNLLTVILGHSDMLAEDLAAQPEQLDDVRVIREAGKRAAALTQQLLAFSRKQVMQTRSLDLNTIIEGVALMLRGLLGEDVRVDLALAPHPCRVIADPGQLGQVLMNLAVNARDAMPGGGHLRIATGFVPSSAVPQSDGQPLASGGYVMLTVRDTGSGMPAGVQRRAFEPFFTTKPVGKGTGLGLATTYGIVRQSGGEVALESEVGQGTTVRIYLPCDRSESAEPTEATVTRPGPGSGTVLLVEDEEHVRSLAERVLSRAGYAVLAAGDGAEALRLAARHAGPIDLLVTDVVMPGISGRELFARLSASGRCGRVLYVSGYPDDEILRRGLEHGETPFLEKPFHADALVSRVQALLDRPM